MLEVAASLCGLHAQLMSSAELTLWARVEGIDSSDVSSALWEDKTLFKTWAMRGTLHLFPSSEYAMWQAGWSTFDHYKKGAWFRGFGMSETELNQLIESVGNALDGALMTRVELAAAVAAKTGSDELGEKLLESWGALLKPASFQGNLCFAPNQDRNVRFTNPRSWLGETEPIEKEEALGLITRRFLGANGPATREDYARWWFMSPARALSRIKKLGDDVAEVDVEGERMWMLAAQLAEAESAPPAEGVNLLPAFDQYVIAATRHVEHLLPGAFKPRIYRPQGWISPVLLVNGRMDGVWQFEKKAKILMATISPFVPLSKAVKTAAEKEVESLARFLGSPNFELEFAG